METVRELKGHELAASLEREAAARAARFAAAMGRPVGVAAIGWSTDPTTERFLAAKARAFERAGLAFRGVVLDPRIGTGGAVARIDAVARAPGVDGLFVQYPVPTGLDAEALAAAVPVGSDIDGGRGAAAGYPSATARAALRLLEAHGIRLTGTRAVVVSGQEAIAAPAARLLRDAGAEVEVAPVDDPDAGYRVGRAALVIAASGRPGSVPGAWMPAGAVVVDTGYYHGGGRGDVAWDGVRGPLAGRVPPVGGVGPVTVAVLMLHAVAAALDPSGR